MGKYISSRNFHGITLSGNGKTMHNVSFDDLPSYLKEVYVKDETC